MKKQVKENAEQGVASAGVEAGTTAETAAASEVKPKARARTKKVAGKVAEPAESVAPDVVATAEASTKAPEVESAAPAQKAAKKAAKKAKATEAEIIAAPAAEAPKAKKAAKTKKDKGRDLVVDEPGAAEVAAVLGEHHAESKSDEDGDKAEEAENEAPVIKGPEPKLERLQKILAKAGISSRRKAEELILGGLVQINGKVVMELGTKADPARDHIRVDGKLLQGPERIRYFVLNKPKGYVTTVSDPEGRPTVMQFFANERERLYPVGRLDYLSEGLLLVTNDGELANKLTKAASGVEKTYLVKVAGQPTEDMLDALREGVVIEKGRPGTFSGRVRTAPAKIRQVRQGDNPWYEVIIIEGRNRELRKMFEEIGHHVEKIRRVGYGPLVLDLEPGKLRELEPEEVHSLRLASEGKLKTRRRRGPAPAQLPTVAGKTVRYKKADGKPGFEPRTRPQPRPEFQTESKAEFRPDFKKPIKAGFKRELKPEFKSEYKPRFEAGSKPRFRPAGETGGKPEFRAGSRAGAPAGSGGRPVSGPRRDFAAKPRRVEPPVTEYVLPPRKPEPPEPEFDANAPRPKGEFNPDYKPGFRAGGKPAFRKDGPAKRFGDKPFKSAGPGARPGRDFAAPADDDDFVPRSKTPGFKIEPVEDKPRGGRPDRPAPGGRSFAPRTDRPGSDGPRRQSGTFSGSTGGARPFRPSGARSAPGGRPTGGDRPFRPRTDGPPQGGKPFRPRPEGSSERPSFGSRPSRPASGGIERARGEFRPRPSGSAPPRSGAPRSGPARTGDFAPRRDFRPTGERPAGRPKPFEGGADTRRDSRPGRPASFSGPKKFGSAKPFGATKFDAPKPAPGGRNSVPSGKLGPDGQPRVKVRARDSFTGKNKGRPKPSSKKDE